MTKYILKTQINDGGVLDFINTVTDETKRNDCLRIINMMRAVTGEEPKMWGTAIVGFGSYHYKYASGHEGDMCRMGFSPRKAALTLYMAPYYAEQSKEISRLGKFKLGKGCIYIKKLSDVDTDVLMELMKGSLIYMQKLRDEGRI